MDINKEAFRKKFMSNRLHVTILRPRIIIYLNHELKFPENALKKYKILKFKATLECGIKTTF